MGSAADNICRFNSPFCNLVVILARTCGANSCTMAKGSLAVNPLVFAVVL